LGQTATLTFDAILGKEYQGKVVASGAGWRYRGQGVVSFTVTIELTDADELVKPGMTAAVNVVVEEVKDVILIPNRAVRLVDGNRVVYILVDNQPVQVKIQLGSSSDLESVIVSGGC
jgi:HlyD family secretion protein